MLSASGGPDGSGAASAGDSGPVSADGLRDRVRDFVAGHDPATMSRLDFLRARFDAGLAAVHYPAGLGGLGLPRALQAVVEAEFAEVGAPGNQPERIGIGLGMAAPTILTFGTEEQKARWVVNGQKVWTSMAHQARWGLLLARTDPDVPKHAGLTYFACDMTGDGVEVRPLRQLTGEAEFNEVFLTGAVIPDGDRIGGVGEGWRVAQGTLMNERVSIGGTALPRDGGMIGSAARAWREHPERRTPGLHDRMLRLWADAEVARLASERLRQQLAVGHPGPEGSAAKLVFARLNQDIAALEVEMAGADGLRYEDWSMRRPESVSFYGRDPGYRYLRARGNSIEGGTSEILRNIIAERVLGLPPEPRTDTKVPWKDLPR